MPALTESRWESSNRRLFVKTVWVDGHHHVVLEDEDPANFARRQKKPRSRLSSGCSTKSAPDVKNSQKNLQNLRVSTVKLLLSGMRSQGKETNHRSRVFTPKCLHESFTIDIIPNDHIKVKHLNQEIQFSCRPTIPRFSRYKSSDQMTSSGKLSFIPNGDNTLSERVLVWLDLATSNGEINPAASSLQNARKGRVATANVCSFDQKFQEASVFMKGDDICQLNRVGVGGDEPISKSARSPRDPNEILVKQNKQKRVEEMRTAKENALSGDLLEINRTKCLRPETAKRQLHIFLPHLPKKSSECDSTLTVSSNNSSSLSKRK